MKIKLTITIDAIDPVTKAAVTDSRSEIIRRFEENCLCGSDRLLGFVIERESASNPNANIQQAFPKGRW